MELIARSISLVKISKFPPFSVSLSPLLFHSNTSSVAFNSVTPYSPSAFLQLSCVRLKSREVKHLGATNASEGGSPPTIAEERWLLEPVGDGDTRHIGFKVEMPGAFEIASREVTVGRLPGKADLVIPVATVSGVHARIRKREGNLLVTDLDSTNGTFIDDKRVRPGAIETVSSGSCITFGDTHLAMFRVSKIENVEAAVETEESDNQLETDSPTENTEIS
ncbi:Zeaxanthin epoxidase, chloroplastic [Quillaja saponaria]|uniref:Zeaxanthin epoxidase, chloroplastic n=1 Tax=Quillaja saponaria TaxID=32244 RepID=A0AAD7PQV6_QUISA|nr:Zeaxanthin epoxidase, chloroplastic [Quillaja saponaria]